MTTYEPQPAPHDLSPEDLDTVVAGETGPASTAPATCGFAYAALTVGGVARLGKSIRADLTV